VPHTCYNVTTIKISEKSNLSRPFSENIVLRIQDPMINLMLAFSSMIIWWLSVIIIAGRCNSLQKKERTKGVVDGFCGIICEKCSQEGLCFMID